LSLDKTANGLCRLFRDTPFPNIQLLAGGNPDERLHALSAIECDLLVVPGGLGDIVFVVEQLSKIGKPVIYVPGIEESLGRDIGSVSSVGREAARDTQVFVLDREAAVLDGVRFLGATFWTSPEQFAGVRFREWFASTTEELRGIRSDNWWDNASNVETATAICIANEWPVPTDVTRVTDGVHPIVAMIENRRAMTWLSSELTKEFAGPTIVVTHYAPTRARPGNNSAADCDARVRSLLHHRCYSVDIWLHGHSHVTRDIAVEGVRIFGGFARAEAEMEIGEIMYLRKLERAAGKSGRKQKLPVRAPILSPTLRLAEGLQTPLHLQAEPLLAEMRKSQAAVEAIVPHTMARSATLRRCVSRTIHAEVQMFKDAASVAREIERALYPPANNLEAAIISTRSDYDVPVGYPSKESKETRFDYYGLVSEMGNHIEWLRELPAQAVSTLARWAQRTYAILRDIEEHGAEARVVAPPVQALRFAKLSAVIEVQVKASEEGFADKCDTLRQAFARDNDWPFLVRLTCVETFDAIADRLLSLQDMRVVAKDMVAIASVA
jgi:hypothetical protein